MNNIPQKNRWVLITVTKYCEFHDTKQIRCQLLESHWDNIKDGLKWIVPFSEGNYHGMWNSVFYFNHEYEGSLLVKNGFTEWGKSEKFCNWVWGKNFKKDKKTKIFDRIKGKVSDLEFNKIENEFDTGYYGNLNDYEKYDRKEYTHIEVEQNGCEFHTHNPPVGVMWIDFFSKPWEGSTFTYPLLKNMYEGGKNYRFMDIDVEDGY